MPEDILGRILRLPGYGAYQTAFDEESSTATLWIRQVGKQPSYTCRLRHRGGADPRLRRAPGA